MSPAEKQYLEPTLPLFEFDSRYGDTLSKFNFIDGVVGSGYAISPKVKDQLNKNYHNGNKNSGTPEATYLNNYLREKRSITEIYNFISGRYNYYKAIDNKSKKEKAGDSFYLNFKRTLAPFYTEIVNNYKAELEAEKEAVRDENTKQQLNSILDQLERENGPNIAEIEASKLKKQIIEGLLYGVPALICLYLIIKKIRS